MTTERKTVSRITTAELMEVLGREPDYQEMLDGLKTAMEPFFEAIPGLLDSWLEDRVTLQTVLRAKVAFLRHALVNGYVEACIGATPAELFGAFGSDYMTKFLESQMGELVDGFQSWIDNLMVMLVKHGVTEREGLLEFGMSGETLSAYDEGTLTMNDLLRQQPMVILKNK